MSEIDCTDHLQRLVAVEQSTKSAHHRIDAVEEQQDVLHELVTSVSVLAEQMSHMRESQAETNRRLTEIENKPAKRWDAVWGALIGAVVGGLAAAIIGQILK